MTESEEQWGNEQMLTMVADIMKRYELQGLPEEFREPVTKSIIAAWNTGMEMVAKRWVDNIANDKTADMTEKFRTALMEVHANDWTMETIAEAAHICAGAISSDVSTGVST